MQIFPGARAPSAQPEGARTLAPSQRALGPLTPGRWAVRWATRPAPGRSAGYICHLHPHPDHCGHLHMRERGEPERIRGEGENRKRRNSADF
jgi:hypothetical protein